MLLEKKSKSWSRPQNLNNIMANELHEHSSIMFSEFDSQTMKQALALAQNGRFSARPNPCVGCVITKGNKVVATGWHHKAGLPHAEIEALNSATESVKGATVYVTLEPCSHFGKTPPCANALIESGVKRVVLAMQDPNPLVSGSGIKRLRAAGIQVDVGLMKDEAESLNLGFVHSMKYQLPWVRLKVANSLDGRTAMNNGDSQWITGAESREKVHELRAMHGAIVTGIGTVLADDPSLSVRLSESQQADLSIDQIQQPIRVVMDAHLSMPLNAKMLGIPGRTIVVTSKESTDLQSSLVKQLIEKGAEIVAVASQQDRLDIESVLKYLHDEEHIQEVMVEAGSIVAGAFIESGYVNELHVFMAPILMGSDAKPMFTLPGLVDLADKITFKYHSMTPHGEDVHFVLRPIAKV